MRPPVLVLGILAIAGLDIYGLSNPSGIVQTIALLAAAALFVLGYAYLDDAKRAGAAPAKPAAPGDRAWTSPGGASASLDARDRLTMFGLGAFSFVLSFVNYWVPPERIFDEVYFARAAEEYLRNQRIYENTHPPLTKLILTLSVMLFGGLSHGDTSYGWRFLDVLFSALAVAIFYALAKRITGSAIWAALAAAFLTFDGMHFVQSRIATPEGIVIFFSLGAAYTFYRFWSTPKANREAAFWLVLFGVMLGCLVGSKWYGVMLFGLSAALLVWHRPRGVRLDVALASIALVATAVYALVWLPDLVRQSPDPNEIHSLADVVGRQRDMFDYHATLRTTHPYASKWWEWPLDYVPVAYYYTPAPQPTPASCCVREITSMPNPLNLWFGLLAVPVVATLAWRERNRAYAFVVLAYLFQWLPWAQSPRISWEYHFYVDIPLICLCNAIVLQRLWTWSRGRPEFRRAATVAVVGYPIAVALIFAYFYPILAAVPISWGAWNARMWMPTWIIGPG
jgi:dolichyl-phosphate-mannose--protein O-mannosyl transferase